MPENDENTGITEEEIRNRLQAEWEEIRDSLVRLSFLQKAIAPSPQETSEEDFVTEVRTTIASAIRDHLSPALRKLRAISPERASSGTGGGPGSRSAPSLISSARWNPPGSRGSSMARQWRHVSGRPGRSPRNGSGTAGGTLR